MASQMESGVLASLQRHFADRVTQEGPSYHAVDWGSAERQQLAFRQMLRVLENAATGQIARNFSLLDYGCGYGALLPYLREHGFDLGIYTGYDMTPGMIEAARRAYGEIPQGKFTTDESGLPS